MIAMTARHEISDWFDRRNTVRNKLHLSVEEISPGSITNALVRSLSTDGALIECASNLAVGEILEVGLPAGQSVKSRIVWCDGKLIGCRFEPPISRAMLSAALLKGVNLTKVETRRWNENTIEQTSNRAAELWPRSLRIALIFGASLSAWALAALSLGVIRG